MLSKTRAHVKSYDDQTKWITFLIEDDDLLEKYNILWDKVTSDVKREFDSELLYKKSLLKTKIKSYGYKAADFQDKKMPKIGSNHTYLAVINSDSTHKESIICDCFQNLENTLKKINDYY